MTRQTQLWGSVGLFFFSLALFILAASLDAMPIALLGFFMMPAAVLGMIAALIRRPDGRTGHSRAGKNRPSSTGTSTESSEKYLVIDCETNGLPRDWRAPVSDVHNWPRAIQIAWGLYDADGNLLDSASHLVRPVGFTIGRQASAIHGITTEMASAHGLPITEVLDQLATVAGEADCFVAHNASFDGSVIAAEFIRVGKRSPFGPDSMLCTMVESTEFCRLPGGPRGYKWPRLDELHQILFGCDFDGAHDAQADAIACARCFFELRKRGVLEAV